MGSRGLLQRGWVRERAVLYQLDERLCCLHLLWRQQQKPLETEVLREAKQQDWVYLFSLLMARA